MQIKTIYISLAQINAIKNYLYILDGHVVHILQPSPMQTVMVVRLFSVLIITARCWYKSQYRLPSINCQAQGHLSTPVKFINLGEDAEIGVVHIWLTHHNKTPKGM